MDTVRHKIEPVSDKVCKECHQNWYGECRAFEVPHTIEEKAFRKLKPSANCTSMDL